MGDTRAAALLRSPVGLALLELLAARDREALGDSELDALLPQLFVDASRHRGDHDQHFRGLLAKAPLLAGVAAWLAARMPRWWSDLDRSGQVWAAKTAAAPTRSLLRIDLATMHREAPKPRRAFWTSTRTAGLTSPWLEWPEDILAGPVQLWKVLVASSARVAEVHSPEDWSRLARRYPGAEAGFTFTGLKHPPSDAARLDPDWHALAEDWDAVHLSTGGWLTAEDVPYSVGGVTTELRGWNMESTAWLRWCFSSVERLEEA